MLITFWLSLALASFDDSRETAAAAMRSGFQPGPISEVDKAAIQKNLGIRMFDSETARYLWPERRDPIIYCGFVNAKNRYGGYVGWTLYIANFPIEKSDVLQTVTSATPGNPGKYMSKICAERGYAVTPISN